MTENTPRRFAYNNNRVFIEEMNDSTPNLNVGRSQSQLPAIRDALTPNTLNNQVALVTERGKSLNAFNATMELNNTQQKMKQLESRLQVNELSNRALLEEVLRLQNELATSVRRSFDTIAEERSLRQVLENNYKFQTENVLQLNNRLKRTEDLLQEDRKAMQSLILYTKTLEQSSASSLKELSSKKDYQSQRLEDLKVQIDDLSRSKENLERSAFGLLEEIKGLKAKVDMESMTLNAIGGDLRNKTRRLEDENRAQMDVMRKHQESMSHTENNLMALRSHLENRIMEAKDMTLELRNKVETEKETTRGLDQQLAIRFNEFTGMINEEKLKYNESLRALENQKREIMSMIDSERMRTNALLHDTKDSIMLLSNEKVERAKDEIYNKIRDLERDYGSKNYESIRKLNEGLGLIERQNGEKFKQLEQVISAEIKLRKTSEKDLNEKLENYNEKFTFAIQSFQSNLGSLGNRMNEQREMFVSKADYETCLRQQERHQTDLKSHESGINSLRELAKVQSSTQDQQAAKLKDTQDSLNKLEKVNLPDINERIGLLASLDQLNTVKKELDEKHSTSLKVFGEEQEQKHELLRKSQNEKLSDMKKEIEDAEVKQNQKLATTEKSLKEQMRLHEESLTKSNEKIKEETKKAVSSHEAKIDKVAQDCDTKFSNLRNDMKVEMYDMNNKLNQHESKVNSQMEKQSNAIDSLKQETRTENEKLKKEVASVESDVREMNEKVESLDDRVKELNSEMKEKSEVIDDLKNQVRQLEHTMSEEMKEKNRIFFNDSHADDSNRYDDDDDEKEPVGLKQLMQEEFNKMKRKEAGRRGRPVVTFNESSNYSDSDVKSRSYKDKGTMEKDDDEDDDESINRKWNILPSKDGKRNSTPHLK